MNLAGADRFISSHPDITEENLGFRAGSLPRAEIRHGGQSNTADHGQNGNDCQKLQQRKSGCWKRIDRKGLPDVQCFFSEIFSRTKFSKIQKEKIPLKLFQAFFMPRRQEMSPSNGKGGCAIWRNPPVMNSGKLRTAEVNRLDVGNACVPPRRASPNASLAQCKQALLKKSLQENPAKGKNLFTAETA
jgi:hypothetical protein